MNTENNLYRPAHIEFQTAPDGSNMPEVMGQFDTAEEMAKFVGGNLTAINQPLTVSRHMDNTEKFKMREEYSDLLENFVPIYEKRLSDADVALDNAKKALKEATENYNAEIAKTKELAQRVKRGLVEMDLDEKYTFRIPYMGKYYFFTWIDKQFRLCLIRPIPEYEKQDLYNSMASNEEYIDKTFAPQSETKKAKK